MILDDVLRPYRPLEETDDLLCWLALQADSRPYGDAIALSSIQTYLYCT